MPIFISSHIRSPGEEAVVTAVERCSCLWLWMGAGIKAGGRACQAFGQRCGRVACCLRMGLVRTLRLRRNSYTPRSSCKQSSGSPLPLFRCLFRNNGISSLRRGVMGKDLPLPFGYLILAPCSFEWKGAIRISEINWIYVHLVLHMDSSSRLSGLEETCEVLQS